MKYLGNKTRILDFIIESMKDFGIPFEGTLIDIFSGTGSVGFKFKNLGLKIISNDIMKYSYYAQISKIVCNEIPSFNKVSNNGFDGFRQHLMSLDPIKGYCFENYAPGGLHNRKYFTDENAKKIDAIRDEIEKLYELNMLNFYEYSYILNSLIDGADYVANISGTYGAYLKIWRSIALKPLPLRINEVYDNKHINLAYNEDSNFLIKKISGEILYIDPPYNQRQYASNFHLLESLAVWDKQVLKGKSGLRNYDLQKSNYNYKNKAFKALNELISLANVKYLVLSYSSEGIIELSEIVEMLKKIGELKIYSLDYRRFRTDSLESNRNFKILDDKVTEYLFICKKY